MHKAARDHVLTRLSAAERDRFHRIVQDMRTRARAVSDHGVTARQVLESQGDALSPPLRLALEAVVARDEMGTRFRRGHM
jgi:DNA invertase Pin-like site-specific DNA recombinase